MNKPPIGTEQMGGQRRVHSRSLCRTATTRNAGRILDRKSDNMTFNEARREIESNEFAARINIASGIATLLAAASEEPAVRQLWTELLSDSSTLKLLVRVKELATENVDLRYRHPRDTALAVFLWLLSIRNHSLANIAAETISKVPRSFWAAALARQQLLLQEPTCNIESGNYQMLNKTGGSHKGIFEKGQVLDEVVILFKPEPDENGPPFTQQNSTCFHLEQMNNKDWYLGIGDTKFNIHVKNDGSLEVMLQEGEIIDGRS